VNTGVAAHTTSDCGACTTCLTTHASRVFAPPNRREHIIPLANCAVNSRVGVPGVRVWRFVCAVAYSYSVGVPAVAWTPPLQSMTPLRTPTTRLTPPTPLQHSAARVSLSVLSIEPSRWYRALIRSLTVRRRQQHHALAHTCCFACPMLCDTAGRHRLRRRHATRSCLLPRARYRCRPTCTHGSASSPRTTCCCDSGRRCRRLHSLDLALVPR